MVKLGFFKKLFLSGQIEQFWEEAKNFKEKEDILADYFVKKSIWGEYDTTNISRDYKVIVTSVIMGNNNEEVVIEGAEALESLLYEIKHISSLDEKELMRYEPPIQYSKVEGFIQSFVFAKAKKFMPSDRLKEILENRLFEETDRIVQIRLVTLLLELNKSDREKTIEYLKNLIRLYKELKFNEPLPKLYHNLAFIYQKLGDYIQAMDAVNLAIGYWKKQDSPDKLTTSLHLKVVIEQNWGKLENAKKTLEEAMTYANEKSLPKLLHMRGLIEENQGNYKNATTYLKKAISMIRPTESPYLWTYINLDLAMILLEEGNYQESERIFQKLKGTVHDKLQGVFALRYAKFLLMKGEVYKAQTWINKAHKLLKESSNPIYTPQLFLVLAGVHHSLGQYGKALNAYKKAIELYKSLKNNYLLIDCLFGMLITLIQMKDLETAKSIQKEIESLETKGSSTYIESIRALSKAIILLSKRRIRAMIEAEGILRNIIENKELEIALRFIATAYLIEILLVDYQTSEDQEIMNEINELVSPLMELGKKTAPTFFIDSKILIARINFAQGDMAKSIEILDEALELAEIHGLESYKEKVKHEMGLLDEKLESMTILLEQNKSVRDRFQEAKIHDYLNTIANSALVLRRME